MDLLDDARSLQPDLVRLREELHRVPEVGLQLPRTQERVLEELRDLPLEISTGSSTTSVTAVLRGTGPAAAGEPTTVLLRGDMDALPIDERSGEDFAATNGAMHACGHDLHTAGLVGAAQLLSAHRDRLSGDVVFMFQPGEEGYDGARVMIEEGVLDAAGRRPDHAYALHVVPHRLPAGLVSGRAGVTLFASYTLAVTVRGTGGHGATPHEAKDPVVAAAEMVGTLQTAVTRSFNVFSPVIVTVGMLRAGTAANIIPDTAHFEATVRAVDPDAGPRLREVFTQYLSGVAAAHGVQVDVELVAGYPATVNDAAEAEFAGGVVRELFGAEHHRAEEHPTQGSEDFSRVLQEVPGALLFLGAHAPGAVPEQAAANHSPMARFDSSTTGRAAALLAGLAAERLGA
ncbi:M20 family metallopeptidase [Saccharopolyspora indica]|uniref:M20 metallopeptidase family protein n=1 Tax=Saccharopolyspora indica TaxID=1229659 RepID=UPI0022EA9A7F|nr:M20 family metallopeptidase [Saccharopolyspora indica]MDA3642823.1 M20 family metallopeptidase [Saccharopolyspora indica]